MKPYRLTKRVPTQLAVLAAAAWVYAVVELAPIGAMPAIASDLQVSEAHVGLLTAAYAFISVISTGPLVRWTRGWPRRRVFVLTLVALTVSVSLSALAPGLLTLAASRTLCAITHGLMWSIVVPIGARLVPPTHVGRAATAVYVGSAAALVVGTPLTTSMSQAWGWRPTMAVLAVAAAAVTIAARLVLPVMTADSDLTDTDAAALSAVPWLSLWRNTRLMVLCGLTLIGVTAHFVSYTYIVPIVREIVNVSVPETASMLVAYGVIGLIAMAILARVIDQRPQLAAAASVLALCLAFWILSAIPLAGAGVVIPAFGVGAILLWGASAASLPPMFQSAAMRAAKGPTEQASALYVIAFQVGILGGSLIGGFVYQDFGISAVVGVSSVLFGVVLAGVLSARGAFAAKQAVDVPCPTS